MSKYLYIIDPGHGGIDPDNGQYVTAGKRMVKDGIKLYEGVNNRDNVKRIMAGMKKAGLECVDIVNNWRDISLTERVLRANKLAKDRKCIYISIHSDANSNALPNPDSFTPYQPSLQKYIGTYRCINDTWKLHNYAKIALALGLSDQSSDKYLQLKIYEKTGFLEINGQRLDEHLPGLFFTASGECLDFRGPMPTWRNWRMKKIK